MIKEFLKRPFSRLLFLWLTGILLQYLLPDAFRWSWLLLLPAVAGMMGARWVTPYYIYDRRWWWGAGFACLLIFAAIQVTYLHERQTRWEAPLSPTQAQIRVEDHFREKARSWQCPATLLSYRQGDSIYRCSQKLYIYFAKDSISPALSPGDCIWIQARFYPLEPGENEGYYRFLRNKGIAATAYVRAGKWKQEASSSGIYYKVMYWRDCLLERYILLDLTVQERAVLSALTLGYTAELDTEIRQRFSATGVAHLLAVSGFHVAIICGLVSWLLSYLPKHGAGFTVRYITSMGLLWLFVGLTGMAVSAVRAALMFSLYLTGKLLRRRSDSYNTLAATAFCLLVYRPYNLFDIGFQLSFLAVFFILLLQPKFSSLLEIRNPLLRYPWQGITVALAAQIGTAPLCLHIFGVFPLVFLFTNLPLALLSTLLIPCTLIWALLEPWISQASLLRPLPEVLTRGILQVVETFGQLPGSSLSLSLSFPKMLACYGVMLFTLIYLKYRKPRVLLCTLTMVLILLVLLYGRENV